MQPATKAVMPHQTRIRDFGTGPIGNSGDIVWESGGLHAHLLHKIRSDCVSYLFFLQFLSGRHHCFNCRLCHLIELLG